MNGKLVFVTLIIGAAVGSVTTQMFIKKKYEKIAQEEIDSVKEIFRKKAMREKNVKKESENPNLKQYTSILQNRGYKNDLDTKTVVNNQCPYVITPEEFGRFDGYDTISLTYYADGVLADEDDERIEDIEVVVGDAIEHFGEYEEDSVFARCDKTRCDYEILLDRRKFSDVVGGVR